MQAAENSCESANSAGVGVSTLTFKEVGHPLKNCKQYEIHASFRKYQDHGILSTSSEDLAEEADLGISSTPSDAFRGGASHAGYQMETSTTDCESSLGSIDKPDEENVITRRSSAVRDLIRSYDSFQVRTS
jgi:hypothetical protein